MELSNRILYICACAALEAKGDMENLAPAIRRVLDEGVTVNELKDAFAQLNTYANG